MFEDSSITFAGTGGGAAAGAAPLELQPARARSATEMAIASGRGAPVA